MSVNIENYLPAVQYNGLNTAKNVDFSASGSVNLGANTTLGSTTPTAGGALVATAGPVGIYAGSGAPTVSAAQGSLYLRTDGSSTSTRLYVNTNGSTTWTNVTTAA